MGVGLDHGGAEFLVEGFEGGGCLFALLFEFGEVKIVDGTSFSLPDTAANQALWPQPRGQQPGCGFPVAKMVGLFSLSSGALLEENVGNLHVHDSLLFTSLWDRLSKGDIVLGDRAFCSYGAMAALSQRGVDTVMRLHQLRKTDWRRGRHLGAGDRLVTWSRPGPAPEHWTQGQWDLLPAQLPVRLVRVIVQTPGFRTRTVLIATTLTDADLYPPTPCANSTPNAGPSNSTSPRSRPSSASTSCAAKAPP